MANQWKLSAEAPGGVLSIRQWQHSDYGNWRIIEKYLEHGPIAYIAVNPVSGAALPKTYQSRIEAIQALKRYVHAR